MNQHNEKAQANNIEEIESRLIDIARQHIVQFTTTKNWDAFAFKNNLH